MVVLTLVETDVTSGITVIKMSTNVKQSKRVGGHVCNNTVFFHLHLVYLWYFSEILSERAGLEKGWFSGYPTEPVNLTNYNASNPFFIYAAFQDVHTPLQAYTLAGLIQPLSFNPGVFSSVLLIRSIW